MGRLSPDPDRLLGDHGPFVADALVCGPFLLEIGIRELVRRQLAGGLPPPGMRPTEEGVKLLMGMASEDLGRNGLFRVYVTHDSILAVLVGHLFGLGVDDFPVARLPGWDSAMEAGRDAARFSWPGLDEGSHPLGG